jgi:hypothetical protein
MKLGYVIFLQAPSGYETYIVNPSPFGFATTSDLSEAAIFDTAKAAYERATKCGLSDWKVGLR